MKQRDDDAVQDWLGAMVALGFVRPEIVRPVRRHWTQPSWAKRPYIYKRRP